MNTVVNIVGTPGDDWFAADANTTFDFDFDGRPGNDVFFGASGDDVAKGGWGNDQLFGGEGNNTLFGGPGDDILVVDGTGNNVLKGGSGNDTLIGANGDDKLIGGDGNDYLFGGLGADKLRGNAGDDHLVGGDVDKEWGGTGADTFQFLPDFGSDHSILKVKDFNIADGDTLELTLPVTTQDDVDLFVHGNSLHAKYEDGLGVYHHDVVRGVGHEINHFGGIDHAVDNGLVVIDLGGGKG